MPVAESPRAGPLPAASGAQGPNGPRGPWCPLGPGPRRLLVGSRHAFLTSGGVRAGRGPGPPGRPTATYHLLVLQKVLMMPSILLEVQEQLTALPLVH